jgi:uncharacterized membrane protein YhiD involved in acid resistance
MKRAMWVALGTAAAISSAAAIGIGAASFLVPQSVSRAQFASAVAAIDAQREEVLSRCDARIPAEREICRVEAGADELVRMAELEASFHRTQESARAAQRARVEARYYVERAKCATLGGAKRDRCLISAHATRGGRLMELAAPYDTRS